MSDDTLWCIAKGNSTFYISQLEVIKCHKWKKKFAKAFSKYPFEILAKLSGKQNFLENERLLFHFIFQNMRMHKSQKGKYRTLP